MEERQYREFVENTQSTVQRARLLAAAFEGSGVWLNALPASTVSNLLDDESLKISVSLRSGALICQPHECICKAAVDASGHHGLSTKK